MPLANQNQGHEFISKGVEVVYLPQNTTSLIQPLGQGFVRSFKAHYTWHCMESIVSGTEGNLDRENWSGCTYAC